MVDCSISWVKGKVTQSSFKKSRPAKINSIFTRTKGEGTTKIKTKSDKNDKKNDVGPKSLNLTRFTHALIIILTHSRFFDTPVLLFLGKDGQGQPDNSQILVEE